MFTNAYVIDRNSVDASSVLRVTVSSTGPPSPRVARMRSGSEPEGTGAVMRTFLLAAALSAGLMFSAATPTARAADEKPATTPSTKPAEKSDATSADKSSDKSSTADSSASSADKSSSATPTRRVTSRRPTSLRPTSPRRRRTSPPTARPPPAPVRSLRRRPPRSNTPRSGIFSPVTPTCWPDALGHPASGPHFLSRRRAGQGKRIATDGAQKFAPMKKQSLSSSVGARAHLCPICGNPFFDRIA